MSQLSVDRNLLSGLAALQLNFISGRDFILAVQSWLSHQDRPLEDVMVSMQIIEQDTCDLLKDIIAKVLSLHHDDTETSLASLHFSSIKQSLGQVLENADEALKQLLESRFATLPDSMHDADSTHRTIQSESGTHIQGTAAGDATLPLNHGTKLGGPAGMRASARFRILRPHARGGLGEVYVAEDTELNREVALKEIQARYSHDESSRSRFIQEAEITGALEHPGVVPVYGLGQYPDGRPYYAMRFIRGDSLKDAADRYFQALRDRVSGKRATANLELRQLLGRFVDVCQAVAYAHSRGVLHRDLKPGNIMLGKYGETLVVDWGLAKVVGRAELAPSESDEPAVRLSNDSGTAPTMMGSAVGTPAFMSPEQAAGRLDAITPASDVYSLGATLYYLLTGKPPVTDKNVSTVLARVRNGDIPAPRSIETSVPRELEAVCMKAMSLAPADRYVSAADLADEVERYLADEPVQALTEPFSVRLRRWTRKHPRSTAAVSASLLVGLACFATLTAVISGKNADLLATNVKLDFARKQAEGALKEAELARTQETHARFAAENANRLEQEARLIAEAKRAEAEKAQFEEARSRKQAEAVTEFLTKVFRSPDPDIDGRSVTVLEALEQAQPELETQFKDAPLIRAALMAAVGTTYHGLGMQQQALSLLTESHKTRAKELGEDDALTIKTAQKLAESLISLDRPEDALTLLEKQAALAEKQYGRMHPVTKAVLLKLAPCYTSIGKYDADIAIENELYKHNSETLGEGHEETINVMHNLANAYRAAGKNDVATPLLEKAVESCRLVSGPDDSRTLTAMNTLAIHLEALGQNDRAIEVYTEVLRLKQAKLGSTHPDTLDSMNHLGHGYYTAGKLEIAIKRLEETLALMKREIGPQRHATMRCRTYLALSYQAAHKPNEARILLEEVYDYQKRRYNPGHQDLITTASNLAGVYSELGMFDKATPMFEDALARSKSALGPVHITSLGIANNLAANLYRLGRKEESVAIVKETLAAARKELGPKHQTTIQLSLNLATAFDALGQFEQAMEEFESTLTILKNNLTPEHVLTLMASDRLADIYRVHGQSAEALALDEERFQILEKKLGPNHPQTLAASKDVALSLLTLGKEKEAIEILDRYLDASRKLNQDDLAYASILAGTALELMESKQYAYIEPLMRNCYEIRKTSIPDNWTTYNAQSMLGGALNGLKRYEEAEPHLREGVEGIERLYASIPLDSKQRLPQAMERMIECYSALNKSEEAEIWKRKLAELRNPPAEKK